MDPERWHRVRQLFDSAIEIEPERRAAYLEEACADDSELRREVLSLLQNEDVSRDGVGEVVADAAVSAAGASGVELESGDRLGRYTILEGLGAGGMGQVYTAEDGELRRKVALKVLTGWMTPDSDHLLRFRREARVLAALNHSNIVTIYSVEHEGDLHFLTMELVQGKTFDRVIPAEGLRLEQFFDFALPLVQAVAAAHEHGVTHRDLKPANVMLSDNGEVKVLDFGLAKHAPRALAAEGRTIPSTTLTRTGIVMGTGPYMSPEQVQGRPVDPRSDIFSLGVILYEMATGSRPFQGDSSADLISSILKEEPPPVAGLARHLPARLAQIIERCLRKEPEKRYQDATSLAGELAAVKEAVEHHPAIARGISRLTSLIPRTRLSRLALTASALAILLSIGAVLDFDALRRRLGGAPPVPRIVSLAVLPLTNLSGDPEQEYLADGVTEVLINELSKIGALKVISRTSMMQYKQTQLSLAEIADELGVDAIVEGSVQRSEDRVRVTAQLIHASSGENLWAESFERDLRDLLALQRAVARAIATQFEVALTAEEQLRLSGGESIDPAAMEAYFRGNEHWNNLLLGPAAESYQTAIDLEPDFAQAWSGLAKVRQMQGWVGIRHPPKVAYPLAQAAVARALELDDDLVEAHAVQGYIALTYDWDWKVAEEEFRRAIEINPGAPDGPTGLSFYLAAMGRLDEAVTVAERARELDPLSRWATAALCEILYYARLYDRALFELNERWDSSFPLTHWMHDRLLLARGDPEAAAWSAFRNAQLWDKSQPVLDDLEEALTTSGASGFWRAMIEFQLAWPKEGIQAMLVAENYTRLGEVDKAFEWLDRAYERRHPLFRLGVDPIWDPLRSDPRFNELLIRLKLPQAVTAEG